MKVNLIEHIEKIAEAAKGSNLLATKLESANESIKIISEFIECTRMQTVLFCVIFLNAIANGGMDFRELANYLEINFTKFFENVLIINRLIDKNLIYKDKRGKRYNEIDYCLYISNHIVAAFMSKDKSFLKKNKIKDTYELLIRIKELFEDRSNNGINYSDLITEVTTLFNQNQKLHFVKAIKSFNLNDYENLLLIYMCNELVEKDNEIDLGRTVGMIFETTKIKIGIKKQILKDKTRMQKLKLIKMQSGFFKNEKVLMLTDNAIKLLFGKDAEVYLSDNSYSSKNIIPSQSLTEKQLYYDERISYDINFITNLLIPEKFEKVQQRLDTNKLQKGLIILFHGVAGTGKTETAMQIAKKTNRDIFKVDISEMKDMYCYGGERKTE